MRGLIKVAALLSSTWAAAFVIPESLARPPLGRVIDYSKATIRVLLHPKANCADRWQEPAEATLKFAIDELDVTLQHPVCNESVMQPQHRC